MTISEYFKVHTKDTLTSYDRIFIRPVSYSKFDYGRYVYKLADSVELYNLAVTQKVRSFGYCRLGVVFYNLRDVKNKVDMSVQLQHAHVWSAGYNTGSVEMYLCLYITDAAYTKLAFACRNLYQ